MSRLGPVTKLYAIVEKPVEQPLWYVPFVCEEFPKNIVAQSVEYVFILVVHIDLGRHEI